ncbi:MAG: cytochrome c-type biogenesis protein [Acetobacteraceae bacterium]
MRSLLPAPLLRAPLLPAPLLRARILRALFLLALLLSAPLLGASAARALTDPSEMLKNPVLEKRAEAIGRQLRCLVCQNESIEASGASLARDLRRIVRQHVAEGWSNRRVIAWMVKRYGTFVLLDPPFEPLTWLLWASPFLALAGGFGTVLVLRRQKPRPLPPLSAAEKEKIADLLAR